MRTKKCKRCGGLFDTDKLGAYMCPACAAQLRAEGVFRERVCSDCGVTFWGYPKSKRCPECQAAVNRARERAFKRNGAKRKLGSIDRCEACGGEYVVESGRQRYCKKCAEAAVLDNVRAHKRAYNAEYMTEERIAAKEANRSNNKVCKLCGAVFDTSGPDVYCSSACKREALRRLSAKYNAEARILRRGINKRRTETLTVTQYNLLVAEAGKYDSAEAFISDCAMSTIWGADAGEKLASQKRLETLRLIWDAVHRPVRDIIAYSGLTQAAFAARFLVSVKTVEAWLTGSRSCPLSTRMMFQQLLGLLPVAVELGGGNG